MRFQDSLPNIQKETDLSDKVALIRYILAYRPCSMVSLADDIILGKVRMLKASLEQMLGLIAEREKVRQNNLRSIESELSKVQAALFIYQCIVYPISPDHKRKSNLERALSDLENRRRQEEIGCWQDTLKLWPELLKIAGEYKATKRKVALITLMRKTDDGDKNITVI